MRQTGIGYYLESNAFMTRNNAEQTTDRPAIGCLPGPYRKLLLALDEYASKDSHNRSDKSILC
jgi:hypothetical protein